MSKNDLTAEDCLIYIDTPRLKFANDVQKLIKALEKIRNDNETYMSEFLAQQTDKSRPRTISYEKCLVIDSPLYKTLSDLREKLTNSKKSEDIQETLQIKSKKFYLPEKDDLYYERLDPEPQSGDYYYHDTLGEVRLPANISENERDNLRYAILYTLASAININNHYEIGQDIRFKIANAKKRFEQLQEAKDLAETTSNNSRFGAQN